MNWILGLLIVVFLTSCGETSTEESSSSVIDDSPYTTKSPELNNGDINFDILSIIAGSQTASGAELLEISSGSASNYIFSLSNAPSFFSVNAGSGELTFTDNDAAAGLYDGIILKAVSIIDSSIKQKEFSIGVNGDPLRAYAWHLENTGQKSFSYTTADTGQTCDSQVDGEGDDKACDNLNLGSVYLQGITGKNIRIAISDSGVELAHDDLAANTLSGEHRDYSLNRPYTGDPVPTSPHGTAVSGIISAVGWNNFGSMGVAPGSKFGAFQFLESVQDTDILISQASGNFRIFNYSYGDEIYQDTVSDSDYIDHIKYQTISDDKIFIKASGNEFLLAQDGICTSHNANYPFENESPYMLIVGALSSQSSSVSKPSFIKATYSNSGSNLWVSAPGGDDARLAPAILTTDLPTCLRGDSRSVTGLPNSFEDGSHSLNRDCHYTSAMNGTSSATPIVTGVVALLLEAEPGLKMRDVKNILARTSKIVNGDHANNWFGKTHPENAFDSVYNCVDLDLSGHEYEQGWVQNNAGFWFNNFYGFGMVDANAAVALAKSYDWPMGTLVEQNQSFNKSKYSSGTVNQSIPDANKDGRTNSITIAGADDLTVESVQVRVNVSHGQSGQVGIELTSPHGTKSILANINNSFLLLDKDKDGTIDGDSNLSNFVLTSNAFYGESSAGSWTIKLIDGKSGTTGSLVKWDINILGHN